MKKERIMKILKIGFGPKYTIRGVSGGILVAVLCIVGSLGLMSLSSNITHKKPAVEVKAIVICCSDPRLCMYKRIRELYGLLEEECFPIIVPGGPDPLANPELMCDECRAVKKHIDLILGKKISSIKTVIIAEHQNCACIEHYGFSDPDHGKTDFPAIKEYLSQRAPQLKQEMLYYSFSNREKGLVNPKPEFITIADE
jgi:hypothetical protein